jgi:hypothetical protein
MQPPLIRQPIAPSSFSFLQTSSSAFGVVAGIIVFKILPPQCLQLSAHFDPVNDIAGKAEGVEQKFEVL